jgi:hypothetical protein
MLILTMPKAAPKKPVKKVVLGSGDPRSKFQSFDLPESLLAHMQDVNTNPPGVPELEIYVDDVLWSRSESFFGHVPDDTIYIVRRDDDNHLYVQFGDGRNGKRLPLGTNNIVAKCQAGAGKTGKTSTKNR